VSVVPEVAVLRKTLSDLTYFLMALPVRFLIFFRGIKKSSPWNCNIQSATLNKFKEVLLQLAPSHRNDPNLLIYSYDGPLSTSKYQIILDDDHLQTTLILAKKRNCNLYISLACPSKCYSSWTLDEVCAEYSLCDSNKPTIADLPYFEGIEAVPLESEKAISLKDELIQELKKRQNTMKDIYANETSRSLIVGSYLIAVTELFSDDLVLDLEREVQGRRGH
ncbi:hypothetical protein BX616_007958, partial [Lobosporangium transversale]